MLALSSGPLSGKWLPQDTRTGVLCGRASCEYWRHSPGHHHCKHPFHQMCCLGGKLAPQAIDIHHYNVRLHKIKITIQYNQVESSCSWRIPYTLSKNGWGVVWHALWLTGWQQIGWCPVNKWQLASGQKKQQDSTANYSQPDQIMSSKDVKTPSWALTQSTKNAARNVHKCSQVILSLVLSLVFSIRERKE